MVHLLGLTAKSLRNFQNISYLNTRKSHCCGEKRTVNANDWWIIGKDNTQSKNWTQELDAGTLHFLKSLQKHFTQHDTAITSGNSTTQNIPNTTSWSKRRQSNNRTKQSYFPRTRPESQTKNEDVQCTDAKGHAKSQRLQTGDSVLVRTPHVNKFSSYYDSMTYKVTDVKGSMITATRSGHMITRNTSFFEKDFSQNSR